MSFFNSTFFKSFILFFLFSSSYLQAAQFITEDINASKKNSSWIALPYLFSSESMGLTVGVGAIANGYIQAQMTTFATVFLGEKQEVQKINANGSKSEKAQAKGISFGVNGYRPFFSNRLFISGLGLYSYFPNQKLYLDGSNDSVKNLDLKDLTSTSPLQTQGYNNWAKIDFNYVLPLGESKDRVLPILKMNRGVPVNREDKGGGIPFVTGQTIINTQIFYTKWTADKLTPEPEYNTNGLRLALLHDNTDYPSNPSRGYKFQTEFSIDFGLANSTQSWNSIDAEYSHYFEFDNFYWTRQNVIALHAWSAYSPSWDKSEKLNANEDSLIDAHRTPMWEGATLGGMYKMRAYDSNRFNDKAALYFSAEYRVIPQFNPASNQDWLPVAIDWFQTVLFVEAGRVAPKYDLGELVSDMKYDAGFSLRALAASVPVRFDMAFGEEGSSMWVMIKQPF